MQRTGAEDARLSHFGTSRGKYGRPIAPNRVRRGGSVSE
jgi:hypothetical protein